MSLHKTSILNNNLKIHVSPISFLTDISDYRVALLLKDIYTVPELKDLSSALLMKANNNKIQIFIFTAF